MQQFTVRNVFIVNLSHVITSAARI